MFDHILIPVAPCHEGEYKNALNMAQKMLNPAGKVSVLSILEIIPAYVSAYIPPDTMENGTNAVRTDLLRAFGDAAEPHVLRGHAANTTLEWAADHGVDCIVVSSHRPGFAGFLIGSTASRISRQAKCSVLVVRDKDEWGGRSASADTAQGALQNA